jgi:hypothetical protein
MRNRGAIVEVRVTGVEQVAARPMGLSPITTTSYALDMALLIRWQNGRAAAAAFRLEGMPGDSGCLPGA